MATKKYAYLRRGQGFSPASKVMDFSGRMGADVQGFRVSRLSRAWYEEQDGRVVRMNVHSLFETDSQLGDYRRIANEIVNGVIEDL